MCVKCDCVTCPEHVIHWPACHSFCSSSIYSIRGRLRLVAVPYPLPLVGNIVCAFWGFVYSVSFGVLGNCPEVPEVPSLSPHEPPGTVQHPPMSNWRGLAGIKCCIGCHIDEECDFVSWTEDVLNCSSCPDYCPSVPSSTRRKLELVTVPHHPSLMGVRVFLRYAKVCPVQRLHSSDQLIFVYDPHGYTLLVASSTWWMCLTLDHRWILDSDQFLFYYLKKIIP